MKANGYYNNKKWNYLKNILKFTQETFCNPVMTHKWFSTAFPFMFPRLVNFLTKHFMYKKLT